MNITAAAQKPVSEFLKVSQELITEVREWANVLWVRVQGLRPRFVSKKVIKMENPPKGTRCRISRCPQRSQFGVN
jgi:hypothetical protein